MLTLILAAEVRLDEVVVVADASSVTVIFKVLTSDLRSDSALAKFTLSVKPQVQDCGCNYI